MVIEKDYIHDFLDREKFGVLSTSDGERIDAAPIYFVVEGESFNILFCTPSKTQKFKNVQKKKEVVLTVTDQGHHETSQIRGEVEVIGTVTDRPDFLKELAAKLNDHMNFETILPLLSYHGQEKMIVRIRPQYIAMRRYDEKGLHEKTITF